MTYKPLRSKLPNGLLLSPQFRYIPAAQQTVEGFRERQQERARQVQAPARRVVRIIGEKP